MHTMCAQVNSLRSIRACDCKHNLFAMLLCTLRPKLGSPNCPAKCLLKSSAQKCASQIRFPKLEVLPLKRTTKMYELTPVQISWSFTIFLTSSKAFLHLSFYGRKSQSRTVYFQSQRGKTKPIKLPSAQRARPLL